MFFLSDNCSCTFSVFWIYHCLFIKLIISLQLLHFLSTYLNWFKKLKILKSFHLKKVKPNCKTFNLMSKNPHLNLMLHKSYDTFLKTWIERVKLLWDYNVVVLFLWLNLNFYKSRCHIFNARWIFPYMWLTISISIIVVVIVIITFIIASVI